MNSKLLEERLIRLFIIPNKQDRILWELSNVSKKENVFWLFAGTRMFQQAYIQDVSSFSTALKILNLSYNKEVYYIGSSYVGVLSLQQAEEKINSGEICVLYQEPEKAFHQGEFDPRGRNIHILKR